MNNQKGLVLLGVALGIIFFILGYIYATNTAENLPAFLPGFQANATNIHTKHSIAAFVAGVACFIYAWFKSAKKST